MDAQPSLFDSGADISLIDPTYDEEGNDDGAWSFKSTIAFWCSVFFMNGSICFIVGATCSFEGVLPAGDQFALRALVAYPYLFGFLNFFSAVYLVYFQVINKLANHGSSTSLGQAHPLVFFARPQANLAHVACLINVFGVSCFGLATSNMFIHGDYTLTMDIPAITGSVCFIVGAVLEGEYNGWRLCTHVSVYKKLPVLQAFCYTGGASLFLVAYSAMWHHWSEASPARADCWVNMPFLVGSVFYLFGAACDIIMWKKGMYGLGFAKTLRHRRSSQQSEIDWRQQLMLWVYCILMSMAQVNVGLYISIPALYEQLPHKLPHFVVELLMYSCIMFLASVIHTTPKQYPYNILLWLMRLVAVIDLYAQLSDFLGLLAEIGYIDHDKGYSNGVSGANSSLNATST